MPLISALLPKGLKVRQMTAGDIPAATKIVRQVGWRQITANWQTYLELTPDGCFAAELDSKLVGTAIAINYKGKFSWIGMVAVIPEMQQRGIGKLLMQTCLDFLKSSETVKLDASPAGKPMYGRLGFKPEYEIIRMVREPECTLSFTYPPGLRKIRRGRPAPDRGIRCGNLRLLPAPGSTGHGSRTSRIWAT